MYEFFYESEEKIIEKFYCYVRSDETTRNDLYLMKWKNGTEIVAEYYTSGDDDNGLELEDPNYEEYTSFIMEPKRIICLNEKDGFNGVEDSEIFSFSYHNFPDEIYNSKGELISKRDNGKFNQDKN